MNYFCNLCDTPTNGTYWCDALCRSLELYKVFSKDSWRAGELPDQENWRLWVNHRHGTPIELIKDFAW